jgi:hypothetical protein
VFPPVLTCSNKDSPSVCVASSVINAKATSEQWQTSFPSQIFLRKFFKEMDLLNSFNLLFGSFDREFPVWTAFSLARFAAQVFGCDFKSICSVDNLS